MLWCTQEPSSGSQNQCLAKITSMVPLCLSICVLPVLWQHIPTCCGCVWFTMQANRKNTHTHTHTKQVGIWRHNNCNAHIDKHRETIPVSLARH